MTPDDPRDCYPMTAPDIDELLRRLEQVPKPPPTPINPDAYWDDGTEDDDGTEE